MSYIKFPLCYVQNIQYVIHMLFQHVICRISSMSYKYFAVCHTQNCQHVIQWHFFQHFTHRIFHMSYTEFFSMSYLRYVIQIFSCMSYTEFPVCHTLTVSSCHMKNIQYVIQILTAMSYTKSPVCHYTDCFSMSFAESRIFHTQNFQYVIHRISSMSLKEFPVYHST